MSSGAGGVQMIIEVGDKLYIILQQLVVLGFLFVGFWWMSWKDRNKNSERSLDIDLRRVQLDERESEIKNRGV
jgi:hypothetical protein